MELLQIVPMLPPAISGVGDYAMLLARELRTRYGVSTRFLNGDPSWRGNERNVMPFASETVGVRSTGAMLKALENTSSCQAALLHYVGYGYEQRGCPVWLVRALELWKEKGGAPLIVLFHEVSGSGPIWTSGFWTAGLQSSLARRLARLGNSLRITTEIAAKRVRAMLPAGTAIPLKTSPVFSTLGELAAPSIYQNRTRRMIVFGGVGWRREAYTRHLPTLESACQRLQIKEVINIGVPLGFQPRLSAEYTEAGVLTPSEASNLMGGAAAGFFTYPLPHIGKSTIFAAYCAHGLLPVTFAENAILGDGGLRPGEHFFVESPSAPNDEDTFAKVATSANNWYQQHRLVVNAAEIHSEVIRLLGMR